jgi:hypothetical protein
MTSLAEAGDRDGDKTHADGRDWVWSAQMTAWLPDPPEAFDEARSITGETVWIFHPVLRQWINSLEYPDDSAVVPGIGGVAREMSPEATTEEPDP